MAKMIPNISPSDISNEGERDVYRILKEDTPDDWVVRYNYAYAWKDNRAIRDGEIDFVVLIPKRGLVVLEVKSSFGYDCVDGEWCRIKKDGRREKAGNPFEQAMGNKHRLVTQMCKTAFRVNKIEFPGLFAFAVIYPRAKFEGKLPESCDPLLMVSHKDLGKLQKRLEQVINAAGAPQIGENFSGSILRKAIDYLSENTELVPVIAPDINDNDAVIAALTRNQYQALQGLLNHQRVHIRGCAGSGKTMLAKWSAEHFANDAKSTLLTCFNRNLAKWLSTSPSDNPNIVTQSFFSLAKSIIQKAGLPFNPPKPPKDEHFWKEEVPSLLISAADKLENGSWQKFDAVIVDEAQDFAPNWWLPLQLLLKDPDTGIIQIFSDQDQAGVYGTGDGFPTGLVEIPLFENCRNTREITQFSSGVLGKDGRSFMLSPSGPRPTIRQPAVRAESRAKTVKAIFNELREQGFKTNQIAILSPFSNSSERSSLRSLKSINGLPVSGDDKNLESWEKGNSIWASTIKAFKGLEADCVILTDIGDTFATPSSISEFYVGSTRGKHLLSIVPVDEKSANHLKTKLLDEKQSD